MVPLLKPLSTMTHIGTLNPADKGIRGPSQEGMGVSFSSHPHAWEGIAKLGGNPWWEVDVSPCQILDGYGFIETNTQELIEWGLDQGLVEMSAAYRATWYDDEMESQMEAVFTTLSEAQDEVGDLLCDDAQSTPIEKFDCLYPTSKLVQAMAAPSSDIGKPSLSALSDLATIWAQRSGLDGVWWEDNLDPMRYSAPRGVLFPQSLKKVSFRQIKIPEERPSRRYGI